MSIYFTGGYGTCSDCKFESSDYKEMVKHCKKCKHDGEYTSQKAIHFGDFK